MSAIKVELELVDGSFTTRMLHAGETIQQFNRNVARSSPELRRMAASGQSVIKSMERMEESSRSFLGTLRDVSIVVGVLSMGINSVMNLQDSWIGKIVQTNAAFERLIYQMRAMSKSTDPIKEAASDVNSLVEAAGKSPFSLDTLTKGFTKLKATGTDPLKGSLQALQDGVAAFGGTDDVFDRATLAITQMSGKGVIQMEELRQQLGEAMPNAVQLMAASMGVGMADLIQKISTGRLAAKPALDLLYNELDRSFGGTAQRMMQTFSGQLAVTRTELQQFAREVGGIDKETGLAAKGGFMDLFTQQLRDLNSALASGEMKNFAESMGQWLSSGVSWLRAGADAAYQFRAAIGNVVEFVAFVAGIKLIGAAMSTIQGGVSSVVRSLDMLKLGFSDANTMLSAHRNALRNTAIGYESVDRLGQLAAKQGLKALASAALGFVPAAAVLGLAIYEVADAFDIFGNRGKEAIETLREFGRIAEDQMGKATKNVTDRQAELNKELEQIAYEANHSVRFGSQDDRKKAIAAEIEERKKAINADERQKEINEDLVKLQLNRNRLAEEAATKIAERQMRGLDDLMEGEQRAYRDRQNTIQKEAEDRIAAADKTGEKITAINEDRQKKLYDSARVLYTNMASQVQSDLDKLYNAKKQGPLLQTDLIVANKLADKINEINAKKNALQPFGEMPDAGQADTSEKDQAKGEKFLTKTKDAVESLQEQLHYSNDELADFHAKFARGAYGDTSLRQVQDLGREIEQLLIKKKALEDIVDGSKDIQQDLEQARIKLIEKRMELNEKASGEELTAGEKIAMRIKEGYYKGFGPNSPALQAISTTTLGLTLQGKTAANVGGVMRDNAFGQQTVAKIVTVTDRLKELLGVMTGIGTATGNINFSNFQANGMGMGFSGAAAGLSGGNEGIVAPVQTTASLEKLMGDAIQHLMTKGWSQVAAAGIVGNLAGESSLNTRARAKGDGTDGSDSIGVAQWNSDRAQRLLGFAQLQGKSWDDFFVQLDFIDHELKTTHKSAGEALKKAQSASGASYDFMRLFEKPSAESIQKSGPKRAGYAEKAYGMGNGSGPVRTPAPAQGPQLPANSIAVMDPALAKELNEFQEQRNALEEQYLNTAAEIAATEKKLNEDEKKQWAADYKKKLKADIDAASQSVDGFDKKYRATLKLIKDGKTGNTDEKAPVNKELLDLARQEDEVNKKMADRKEAMNNLETTSVKLKQDQANWQRRIAEYQAKTKDPNIKLDSSSFIEFKDQMDKVLEWTATVYGKDSEKYKEALAEKTRLQGEFARQEAWADSAASSARTRDLNTSLMTERQQREYAMQQRIAEIDAQLAYYKQNGAAEVDVVRQLEAEKAAIRKQYNADSPMAKQMKEWSDLSGNLEKATTGWMDSMVDGLAGVITGTGNLKQAINGIVNDLVKISLKGIIGQMKSGTASLQPAAGAASGLKGLFSKGAAVGARHAGGAVGVAQQMQLVDPSVFKHARKFHSGANEIGGRKLFPGEVPIIAKDDEGIFTPEQMKAIGAGNSGGSGIGVTINAPVTVNANGGTPEQNNDLAKQTAKEMEKTMRGVVADEIQRQMRPGNMMNSGRKR